MDDAGDLLGEIARLRERLSLLSQASLRINESLEFDQVLQGVLDSARSLTSARYGVMTLLDEGGGVRRFLTSEFTPGEAERRWLTPDPGRLFEVLANISEPLRLPDLAEYVRGLGFADFSMPLPVDVFRFMAAPIFHRGERVGHVFVGDREDGSEFSQADEETLVMFASQAALVIANAGAHREERRARADLETLVNTSPVGVVVLDAATGMPVSVNREAMRLVEGLREEGQGAENLLDVVTCARGDGREVSLRELPLAEALRAGETVRAEEITLRVPDGRSISILLNATPIHGDDGQLASFVVTLQDLTPLEEQERLRAEFLGMVSRELRTPLAAVRGSVTTLLESGGALDPAEMAEFHRIILDQSDQARLLISDLLEVAHIETGSLAIESEPADIRGLVEEAAERFRSGGARHPLHVDLAEDLPMVMVDKRRIVQVLYNLLSNVAGYSHESLPVAVSAERDGVRLAVSVVDQGRAIPSEMLPELFRRFSRAFGRDTSPGVGGSGLSLAICKGIVEAHGGRIRAESDSPGQGATFTFTLPIAEGMVAAVPLPAGRTKRTARDGVRVLAMDDDPQSLRYVRDTLTRAGYAPIITGDPADVLRLMVEERPHLVLLNLVLPDRDGVDLMNNILRIADVPVIFMSVYGQDDAVARALDMGAADYLVKPFSPTELTARIRAVLRRRLEPFAGEPAPFYDVGGLTIEYAQRRVAVAGAPVNLTATEYGVLYELAVHAPRALSHSVLLQRVWGPERIGKGWLLRDVVKRLRRKLGDTASNPKYVITEPRAGYRMPVGETADQVEPG